MRQVIQGHVQKGLQESTSTVVSPDSLSPTPSASSGMKSPENTEDDRDGREPAEEGERGILL